MSQLHFNFSHIFTLSLHGPGLQRRRLIPAPLPDTSSLGKSGTTGQWVDLPPMSGPLKEPFEIKVYEIDDVERLQRRRQEKTDEVRMGFMGVFLETEIRFNAFIFNL